MYNFVAAKPLLSAEQASGNFYDLHQDLSMLPPLNVIIYLDKTLPLSFTVYTQLRLRIVIWFLC